MAASMSFGPELVARALALFDTVALLWLGMTVVLNAERRHVGTWLTGGGLLIGGFGTAAHLARLGAEGPLPFSVLADWWRLTWFPFAGAPYLWYAVLAWYAGRLRTAREWLTLGGVTVVGLSILLVLLVRVPLLSDANSRAATRVPGGTESAEYAATLPATNPTLALILVVLFSTLCVALGVLALRNPRIPDRFMGDLAFRRSRPWLTATSGVVLGVGILAGIVLAGPPIWSSVGLDILGLALLGFQVVLMGRAVVSYEVFTGKALPRGGLARHWKNSLLLAAGFGISVALSLELPIGGIYRLLVATVLVAVFYALVSWRTFSERERTLDRLRPFVVSEHLYDRLLGAGGGVQQGSSVTEAHAVDGGVRQPAGVGMQQPAGGEDEAGRSSNGRGSLADPFRALCGDVLGASIGYLCPLGPLAPLVGPALAHPTQLAPRLPASNTLDELAATADSPRDLCAPIDPARHGGARWSIPLWGERGLIGVLLLGDKRDGGLYTQEEIEIARATGERLIDARATAELARRLLLLQRRRLAEDQILEGRARRSLHDDVLPLLHAAILQLNSAPARAEADSAELEHHAHARVGSGTTDSAGANGASTSAASVNGRIANGAGTNGAGESAADPDRTDQSTHDEVVGLLTDAHRRIGGLLRELPSALGSELAKLGLVGALRRAADDCGEQFATVAWRIGPDAHAAADALPPLVAEVVFGAAREAVRNAARHGHHTDPPRPLNLTIELRRRDGLEVRIEDDGVGLGRSAATTGGGQGLTLHGTLLAVLGGSLQTESAPDAYTRVIIRVPIEALGGSQARPGIVTSGQPAVAVATRVATSRSRTWTRRLSRTTWRPCTQT